MSPSSASKAEKLGYTNVKVFHDGLPAWKKAGNMIVSTPQYLKETMDKGFPPILIDVRSVNEAKRAHIDGAVSVPSQEMIKAKDIFPASKSAPIMLYAADTQSAEKAFVIVRGWGYGNTSILEGGVVRWKELGNPVVSGELKTSIVYIPKLRPGEISIEEFKGIAETSTVDKLILDVRDEDEARQGMLKGATNMPTQAIPNRLGEIPKDKEIIAYCANGVRAEMVYYLLKDAGYKVRFLNASLNIDKDGKYTITKE